MDISTLYVGRPENCADRLTKERRCYDMLDKLGIAYSRVDHEHADTIEACHDIEKRSVRRSARTFFSQTVSRRSFIFCSCRVISRLRQSFFQSR